LRKPGDSPTKATLRQDSFASRAQQLRRVRRLKLQDSLPIEDARDRILCSLRQPVIGGHQSSPSVGFGAALQRFGSRRQTRETSAG